MNPRSGNHWKLRGDAAPEKGRATGSLLEGVFPAIHTAFDDEEKIDAERERQLVRFLLRQGVHGLFVCGTTGEFPVLSLEEREEVAEVVASEALAVVPIIVQVGAPRPRDAVRLAQHAARLGVQAISSIPPCYYSYRPDAVFEYIADVASATSLPFYYYHIPERTRFFLDEKFVERLLGIPNLVGIKYSHGNFSFLEQMQALYGPRLRVFCGMDELFLSSLVSGACGGIGATYCFLAPLFVSIWTAFRQGDVEKARLLQAEANRILAPFSRYPFIAAGKEILHLLGIDVGLPRLPQSRLEPEEKTSLRRDLMLAGMKGLEGVAPESA